MPARPLGILLSSWTPQKSGVGTKRHLHHACLTVIFLSAPCFVGFLIRSVSFWFHCVFQDLKTQPNPFPFPPNHCSMFPVDILSGCDISVGFLTLGPGEVLYPGSEGNTSTLSLTAGDWRTPRPLLLSSAKTRQREDPNGQTERQTNGTERPPATLTTAAPVASAAERAVCWLEARSLLEFLFTTSTSRTIQQREEWNPAQLVVAVLLFV